ncbi:hypothetical protein GCM10010429_17590 [Micromonospora olivasterospora]|uniref:Uncharacterized protein n=1 Tax=Micromonospora olivasterospora TaxID=1880 RepID=A0A562I598_MICOL|nr:hypothetical protein JD77_01140 [Micromonospora olivasterospora]
MPAGKQAPPSGASCQVYEVPATACRERAITRLVNPAGNWMPLASAAPSGPYGLGPGWAGAADATADQRLPETAAVPPATVASSSVRRSIPTSRRRRCVVPTLPTAPSMKVNVRRDFPHDWVSTAVASGRLTGVTRSYRWFRQPAGGAGDLTMI